MPTGDVYAILPNAGIAAASKASSFSNWAAFGAGDSARFFADPQTPHAEIAAELGVTETVVDNRLCRMRTTFRARLAALGLLTLLLLSAVLFAPWEKAPATRPAPKEPAPSVRRVPAWDAGTPRSDNSSSPVRENRALPD